MVYFANKSERDYHWPWNHSCMTNNIEKVLVLVKVQFVPIVLPDIIRFTSSFDMTHFLEKIFTCIWRWTCIDNWQLGTLIMYNTLSLCLRLVYTLHHHWSFWWRPPFSREKCPRQLSAWVEPCMNCKSATRPVYMKVLTRWLSNQQRERLRSIHIRDLFFLPSFTEYLAC